MERQGQTSQWQELAHFVYGRGFWYTEPQIEGLTEEQLYWVPDESSLCILWHVGHIAHRERLHIGRFLQGIKGEYIPPQYEVFGTDWCTPDTVREAIESVEHVVAWANAVREQSHEYIASIPDDAFHTVPPTSEFGMSIAQWLFATAGHTAVHIGRIQMLRAMVEGKRDRTC